MRGLSSQSTNLVILLIAASSCLATMGDAQPIQITNLKVRTQIEKEPVELTVSGSVSTASPPNAVRMTVDLGNFQEHLTAILADRLNRADKCGERLSVEQASLEPQAPSGLLTANINYERYACAKAFGREIVKRLAGGHGVIEVKLTPQVADNNISLDADVRKMDADGSLGALLRSDSVGEDLKQDIGDSIESAIQQSADLKGVLPAEVQKAVTLRSIRFADGGSGRLWLSIEGQVRLTADELRRAFAK